MRKASVTMADSTSPLLPEPLDKPQVGSSNSDVLQATDWLLWQLVDSAFPTGGYAHSNGLEAAWHHGEVRQGAEFLQFAQASLHQLGHAVSPFVSAAHAEPDRLQEFDQLCEAFTTQHVANRASRLQGRAFLMAVERIFAPAWNVTGLSLPLRSSENAQALSAVLPFTHLAPVFGAATSQLGLSRGTSMRVFFFHHVRGLIAAAVRLSIFGPIEAQKLQYRLSAYAEETIGLCAALSLADLAQTAPLLDLWQGGHDRLYSRLFQS